MRPLLKRKSRSGETRMSIRQLNSKRRRRRRRRNAYAFFS